MAHSARGRYASALFGLGIALLLCGAIGWRAVARGSPLLMRIWAALLVMVRGCSYAFVPPARYHTRALRPGQILLVEIGAITSGKIACLVARSCGCVLLTGLLCHTYLWLSFFQVCNQHTHRNVVLEFCWPSVARARAMCTYAL